MSLVVMMEIAAEDAESCCSVDEYSGLHMIRTMVKVLVMVE